MENEQWINEILKSTDGMMKISPDDALFSKIQNKIDNTKLSSKSVWMVAASFLILMTLNAKFVFEQSFKNKSQTEIICSTIIKSNQLYSSSNE